MKRKNFSQPIFGIDKEVFEKTLKNYFEKWDVPYTDCCGVHNRTLNEDNWVSVTDFGAIGDGVTDDTVTIQAALDSGANTILFPAGVYAIEGTLTVPSFTTIFGYGATLLRTADTTAMMLNQADGITGGYDANQNIKIFGLKFNGNMTNFAVNCTLLALGHVHDILIRDCEFFNIPVYHGIEVNGAKDVTIDRCMFHDTTSISEFLQLDVMNGPGLFPWFGPFDNTICDQITVINCIFHTGASGVGSHSGSDGLQHKNIIISNNSFRDLTFIAIAPYCYQNTTITDNQVENCAFGINGGRTSPAGLIRNFVITGNRFNNIYGGVPLTWGRAIEINTFKDTVISNNQFYKIFGSGITLHNCDRFTITDNLIRDYGYNTAADSFGINLDNCNTGTVTNNQLFEDPTGFVTSTSSISINNGGGANITVENNTVTTVAATDIFTNFTGASVIVGMNIINGKITPYINSKAANYTYNPSDSILNVNTAAGNVTITINPAIFNKAGLTIRKTTGDANTVIISPSSGTVNGAANVTLTTNGQVAIITSDWVNLDAIIK